MVDIAGLIVSAGGGGGAPAGGADVDADCCGGAEGGCCGWPSPTRAERKGDGATSGRWKRARKSFGGGCEGSCETKGIG